MNRSMLKSRVSSSSLKNESWYRVLLTNYSHVGEDGEDIAPADASKFDPSLKQTTWGVGKECGDKFEHQGADNLNKGQGTHAQSLQHEVRNVEIGRLG